MAGGLLNLIAYGNQNVIINGNPTITMFKSTWSKYTNFGIQKFRLDFNGQKKLKMNQESKFIFDVPRYGDLLFDTYLSITLPTIWSPIYPPQKSNGSWQPYEFKWIENIGSQMIKEVNFYIGGQKIQSFTGQYLYNIVERDFNEVKKSLYYEMTGNVNELNDPANAYSRGGHYPNAYYFPNKPGSEPSISARQLYIPLNIWFTLCSKMAFPLVCLQYNELQIEVIIRPVCELFLIKEIVDNNSTKDRKYIYANQKNSLYHFHKFLQQPTSITLDDYTDNRTNWHADVHLISNYVFLSDDERIVFANSKHKYLVKQSYEYKYNNVTGSKRVKLESLGLITNWMWFFQRSDIKLRNQWSNYSNWAYENDRPRGNIDINDGITNIKTIEIDGKRITPYKQGDNVNFSFIKLSGEYSVLNIKEIMTNWALLFDGVYREQTLKSGVLNYIEKYIRTKGNLKSGAYCYNFCLDTDPFNFQPNGAINLSKFSTIEFEIKTIQPPLDSNARVFVVCDPVTSLQIGENKPITNIYDYYYDLTILEERINILSFDSGNAALEYSR